jgi:hypothetical protein
MSEPISSSPLQRKTWRILFLLLSIVVVTLFSIHTIIIELARHAALRLDALMYTQNLLNSGLSIEIGTWLLIMWLIMVTIFFAVHPGHKSSPFDWLLVQGFIFGLLLATLWNARSQIFLQFDYAATPPEVLIFYVIYALPVYEFTCGGLAFLVVFFMIFTWFKVIKFEPDSSTQSESTTKIE